MKNKAWLILCVISFVAALALALTNLVTSEPIKEQALRASDEARLAAMPDAESFETVALEGNTGLDSLYAAKKGGEITGYVGQATVAGYGGPIEVVLGVDVSGKMTGMTVGGSEFSETAGLGSLTREPEFTSQFIGLAEAPSLGGNVDAVSGATISSTAVTNGVKTIYEYVSSLAEVKQ